MLGDRIKKARRAANISQVELAEKIGVTQQAIQSLESNKTQNPRKLKEIAKALSVSLSWLQSEDDLDDGIAEFKKTTPDPLSGLTPLQRELILKMNSLSEKQQLELLKTAEEQAEKNEEFLADYLKRNRVA